MSAIDIKDAIRFYFSFNDPYSFIIIPAVKNLSHAYRVEIDYIPLAKYDRSGMFSGDEATQRYYHADALKFAEKAGRKLLYKNEFQNSNQVIRGKYYADGNMLGLKYINLVFALRWVGAKDISKTSDVVEGLKFLEMEESELVDAMQSEKYSSAVAESEALAKMEGVIGVPFLTFRGAGYFGAHRLEYLEDVLKNDPALIVRHDAGYAVIMADELAEKLKKKERVFILDVRIPKDFAAGHIPGSNCLPAKVVRRNIKRLDRPSTTIVVDDGGVEASEIGFLLASEGFKSVSVLSQGYKSWTGGVETGLDTWQDKLKPAP